jgi:hypothetical protein
MLVGLWHRILSSPVLTLNGYVAFNIPRTVTALGAVLLLGVIAFHVYLLGTEPELPAYFFGYVGVLTLGCAAAAGAIWFGRNPAVPQRGWYLGSAVCTVFIGIYLASRFAVLPGLVALTGRWDVAPGTFAMACAGGFIVVHTTVLSGINVAYPQRRDWHD